ncbi:MAG: hypothetical protein ABIQ32_09910 [Sphingomicrobium sp.]
MSARFSLDGSMIPRQVKRLFDQRAEPRIDAGAISAVLSFRGRDHVVSLSNDSPSGAMIRFSLVPHIGDQVMIQMMERGTVAAEVRWVRDGCVGLAFSASLE